MPAVWVLVKVKRYDPGANLGGSRAVTALVVNVVTFRGEPSSITTGFDAPKSEPVMVTCVGLLIKSGMAVAITGLF